MINRILCATVATLVLAAAPALAQCGKTCGKDKATCQVKQADRGGCNHAQTVSTDGKTCTKDGMTCSKDGKTCSKDGKVCATAGATCCKDGQGCCGKDVDCSHDCSGAMAQFKGLKLPRMAYQVGDKRMSCPKSAAALAKDELKTIKYVVADTVYEDKTEALAAQAEELNKFLDDALTVKYAIGDKCVGCPNAAKAMAQAEHKSVGYRVASFNFADRESAEQAATSAREAAKKVEMKAMVGDQAFCCPKEAAAAAKAQGKEVEFCVGKMKTGCEASAKLELAMTRIKAALEACESSGGKQIAAGV